MIRRPVIVIVLAAAALLAGCADKTAPLPKSPDQALYEAHAAYVGALLIVTRYGQQPMCPNVTWADGCANRNFLLLAKKASDSAASGLTLAQPIVDAWKALAAPTPIETAGVNAAVQSAAAGVAAVTALSDQIAKPTS